MTISFFVVNLINSMAMVYASSKIMNSKINYKDYKVYISMIILTLYSFFMYQYIENVFRMFILVQLYVFCNFLIHKEKGKTLTEITITSIMSWLLLVIAELVSGLLLFPLLKIFEIDMANNWFANNLISLFVILVFFVIISLKPIIRLLNKGLEKFNKYKIKSILSLVIFISLLFSMMLYLIYFELSKEYMMFILLVILLEYTAIIYIIISDKEKTKDIQSRLDTMIDVTTGYEKALEENRINNHENKNQLIVVKDMIDPKNKKAHDYLKQLMSANFQDDDNLLIKVSSIPMGGLRGLIYYKLLTMKEKKIDFSLTVSKNIKKNILNDVAVDLLQSYCKIVGVFVDNAIEAVEQSDSKIINIEIYKEDNFLVLSVCNKYKGQIDFENLGKTNMTTKGENHGYGLKLVERLLKENYKLINQKKIIGDLFVQVIKLNIC